MSLHLETYAARIVLLAPEQGGREMIFSGYRPAFYFFPGGQVDGDFQLPDSKQVHPAQAIVVTIRIVHPEHLTERPRAGTLFDYREGHRVMGYGVVL